MKVAAIMGRGQGGVLQKPDPIPKDDIVIVKVYAAPMCTEYHAYRDGHVGDSLGHEAAGEVVATDRATRVKPGDRVVVQPQHACGRCALCEAGAHIHCQHGRDVLAITGSEVGTATMAQYVIKSEHL